MEKEAKKIKITLEGSGFKYSLFEVKDEDMNDFLDTDRGIYLRNRFKKYVDDDMRRMASGKKSEMIELYTLVDDPLYPARVSVTDGESVRSYRLNSIKGWDFIVAKPDSSLYEAHLPEGMPAELLERIEALISEYLEDADEKSINALNGEYITFFNLYTPHSRMLLCMRTRDNVRSEFVISLDKDEKADIDKLSVMCRQAQEVIWHEDGLRNEYDANSLIYDSRWHSGEVHSQKLHNSDYFVTTVHPTAIDGRWFESWAV